LSTDQEFARKIVIVTGAGSGIGRATALAFARQAATVIALDVNQEAGGSVAAEICTLGGKGFFLRCDVRDKEEIRAAFERVIEEFGRIDCAFNNAGIGGPITPMGVYPDDAWEEVIASDLRSIWLCMKHEIGQMLKQGGGTIVNCSSVVGLVGMAGMSAYSAAKHGIMGLTKSAALDYATQNIRINAVCPGTIHTPAVDAFLRDKPDQARIFLGPFIGDRPTGRHPIGRLGAPEEVADAVIWLSSSSAKFVLGQGIVVDGGYVAR